MRWMRVVVLAVLAAVLQVSLMGALRVYDVVPNLVLVVLVAQTIWGRASEALLFAVLAGIIVDAASAGSFGLATSSLVVITLALVAVYQLGLDGRVLLTRLSIVAGASLLWGVVHVLALGLPALSMVVTWRVIALETVINVILAIPIGERVVRGARSV